MYAEIYKFFLKKKYLVLCSSLVGFFLAIVISLFLQNIYAASSTVSPTRDNYNNSSRSQLGTIAQSIGFAADDATPQLKFAHAYFYSYKFLANFIIKYDLIEELLLFKKYDPSAKQILFKPSKVSLKVIDLFPNGDVDISNTHLQKAVEELRELVRLSPGRENDPSMYLTVFHQSPDFAYFLNKELLRFLNQNIKQLDQDESRSKIAALELLYGEYEAVEVKKAISGLIEAELTKLVLSDSNDGNSFLVLDPPLIPYKKYSPRRTVIALNGFLLGLLLSIVYLIYVFFGINNEKLK